jgi:2,4-dienoyl-CoA reductase (NADPH2)
MNDVAATDFIAYSERIANVGMKVLTSTRLEKIDKKGAVVSGKKGEETLKADTVILALGFRSCSKLYDELKESGKEAYLVGDAVHPGKIFDAIHTGYRAGLKV